MMVSTISDVLPVWRSPMMSSRWPRPIGIIASMAFEPVCSGSFTGCRSTTPGALNSTGRKLSVSMGPLSSSGSPSGLDHASDERVAHRHLQDAAGALDRVALLDEVSSPSSTAPTLSSSRLSASPTTSWGSSSISLVMALRRP